MPKLKKEEKISKKKFNMELLQQNSFFLDDYCNRKDTTVKKVWSKVHKSIDEEESQIIKSFYGRENDYAKKILSGMYTMETIPDDLDVLNSDFCKIRLRTENIDDPCNPGGPKKIIIIHFLHEKSPTTKFTNEYCGASGIKLEYTIEHIPIPYDEPEPIIKIAQGLCDDVIIYARVENIPEFLRICNFLLNTKQFRNTTLFLITDNRFFIPNKYLTINNITGLKVLNVIDKKYTGFNMKNMNMMKRYEINDTNYFIIRNIDSETDSIVLECNWWFKYYITKAFYCGKGRLKQFAGTCYLNSVLNGIILSENFSKIFISKMKELMRTRPDIHTFAKKDDIFQLVHANTCPPKDSMLDIFYVLKILYNIFCMSNRPLSLSTTQENQDFMLTVSKKFYSEKIDPKDPEFGEGGWSHFIMYNILVKTKINFLVKVNDNYLNPRDADGKYIKYDLQSIRTDPKKFTRFLNTLEKYNGNFQDIDVILFLNVYSKGIKMSDEIQIESTIFTVEFSVIRFNLTEDDEDIMSDDEDIMSDDEDKRKKITGHAVTGYTCDKNRFKVYDSGINIISDLNWLDIDTVVGNEDARIEFKMNWEKDWEIDIEDVSINFSVYVNIDKIDEYRKTGFCHL
jgi:hypothetical protein